MGKVRREQLAAVAKAAPADPKGEAWAWWEEFWNRSRIVITPRSGSPESRSPDSAAWQVGRNYQLARFMLACNAYGALPTKFNGGIHTFDSCHIDFLNPGTSGHPDHRGWGGVNFVGQNQRLLYWPMLKSGDWDMMPPQLNFYANMRRNGELYSKAHWGIEAASFIDQGSYFGLPVGALGNLRGKPVSGDEELMKLLKLHAHYFTSQVEFSWMMLEYARYGGRDLAPYLPFIESTLKFYDQYYQMRCRRLTGQPFDANGKLVFYPAKALETYPDVKNPTDVLTGLTVVLKRLLELPDSLVSAQRKAAWHDMLGRLPAPAYFSQYRGRKVLLPGERYGTRTNGETPQLYPVFPYRTFGVGRPDLQVAIDSWRYGGPEVFNDKGWWCWYQNNIFAACMGLTDDARRYTVAKLMDSGRRFPAIWGSAYDETPDMDHGGSGMIGLQDMLLQEKDENLYLLPAWPGGWPVEFKLHAPWRTVVEAAARNGGLERLSIKVGDAGRDRLRLHAVGIGGGRVVLADGSAVPSQAAGPNVLEFPVRPGATYRVEGLRVPEAAAGAPRTLFLEDFEAVQLSKTAKAKGWQRAVSGNEPVIEVPPVPGATGKALKAVPQSVLSYDLGRSVRGIVRLRAYAQSPSALGTVEILNGDAGDTSYQKTVANLAQGKPTLYNRVYSGVMVGLHGAPAWGLFAQDKAANFMYQKLDWQAVGDGLEVKPGWVELTLDAREEGLVTVTVKELAGGKQVSSRIKAVPFALAGGFRYLRLGCYGESAAAPVWFDEVVVTEDQP